MDLRDLFQLPGGSSEVTPPTYRGPASGPESADGRSILALVAEAAELDVLDPELEEVVARVAGSEVAGAAELDVLVLELDAALDEDAAGPSVAPIVGGAPAVGKEVTPGQSGR